MLYGTPQSGWNPPPNEGLNITAVGPGESATLLAGPADGTPSTSTKSVAIARGFSPLGMDYGTTFICSGTAAGTTVDVQGAAQNVDTQYSKIATMTPDANGNASYTDTGKYLFYRVQISAYTTGNMPVVTANR